MTYTQALEYIHSTMKFGSKPGLERIRRLLHAMGDPQNDLKFVHVAGTNGKGSICKATASVLAQAGYQTGLYVSPYVIDFCERIQIDGHYITHEQLAQAVSDIRPFVDEVAEEFEHPTEFEIITALAFRFFKESGCDIVVLEVGLGGRFDATNVIGVPLISIIASISYDHMAILGDTLSKIAFEKCGIIKTGGATVTNPGQEEEALSVIRSACAERENTLVIPQIDAAEIVSESIEGTEFRYKGQKMRIPMCGRHQIANFLTVFEAVCILRDRFDFHISPEAIAAGFQKASFPARVEILNRNPLILLDGGHNPSAAKALRETLERFLPGRPIEAVMGIFSDKDYPSVIGILAPLFHSLIAVRPNNPRALDPAELTRIAKQYCDKVTCCENLTLATQTALQRAGDDGVVLICGSFYLAGPMRSMITENLQNLTK